MGHSTAHQVLCKHPGLLCKTKPGEQSSCLCPEPTWGRLRAVWSFPKPCPVPETGHPAQTMVPTTAELQGSDQPSPCHSHTARGRCPGFDVQWDSQQNWLQVSPALRGSPQEQRGCTPCSNWGEMGLCPCKVTGKGTGLDQHRRNRP